MVKPPTVIKTVCNIPCPRFRPINKQVNPRATIINASILLCCLKDLNNDSDAKKILKKRKVISSQKCSIQNKPSNKPRDISNGKTEQ